MYLFLCYHSSASSRERPKACPRGLPPRVCEARCWFPRGTWALPCGVLAWMWGDSRACVSACGTFHGSSCVRLRVVMTCGEPEWEICDKRGGRQRKLLLKERKCLGFKKARLSQAAQSSDQWKKGSRQAPHLIFLLGAQVDKLATLFAAFFSSPLCTIRTANRIHAAATVVSY